MIRHPRCCIPAAVICVAVAAPHAYAQFDARAQSLGVAQSSSSPHAYVHGIVLDDRGEPLAGAVVSALGSTTVFAVSDDEGRFAFRNLPYGPYLMRAHLQGYLPPRARLVQVNRSSLTVSTMALTHRAEGEEEVPVLTAGVGGADVTPTDGEDTENHDHGEVAWRLRHLKRSVLKDAVTGFIDAARLDDVLLVDSLAGLGRAVGTPARVASSFLAGVPWNGYINLLTSTSFDRPQDLFSMQTWPPRGVAFVSLEAPTSSGHWAMRGAATQGDLSSWVLAGSYLRAPAAHRYEAGLSYGMQRFLGGTADTRAAVSDGGRNVGAVYAYDDWTLTPHVAVTFGAKYARYDYLADRGLFSPRAGVTITPFSDDTLKLRAAVSRRVVAPGAEEFIPPSTGLWLPPERTFSTVSPRRGFTPERLQQFEVAAEREWAGQLVLGVRAFRQRVDEQLVTVFGVSLPGTAPSSLGRYYVASAGDFEAGGWGVSLSRTMTARLRASIDYTQVESAWLGASPDAATLSLVAVSVRRGDQERFHDVTATIDSTLPLTETRVFAVYKVNSRFADAAAGATRATPRFDVQLNQALPFLNFGDAEWEMLVAVRSLFREGLLDTSVYDELLVVHAPKRVVGGVTVRF